MKKMRNLIKEYHIKKIDLETFIDNIGAKLDDWMKAYEMAYKALQASDNLIEKLMGESPIQKIARETGRTEAQVHDERRRKASGQELSLYVVGSLELYKYNKPSLIVFACSPEEALRIANDAWIGRTFNYAGRIESEGVQNVLGMLIEI